MRRVLPVLILAVSLVAGACGGGGSSTSAYCQQLKDVAKQAQRTTSTSAANMHALETAFDKALDKIAKKAPSEIKDDYAVLQEYVDLRFQAVINPAKANAKRLTELQPKYTQSSKNITDYNKKVCKFETTTTTPRVTVATAAVTTSNANATTSTGNATTTTKR